MFSFPAKMVMTAILYEAIKSHGMNGRGKPTPAAGAMLSA